MFRRCGPSALLASLLLLALAGCDSDDPESGYGAAPTTVATPATSDGPATTATVPAPDFTLKLGEGGTFRLSDEQKPVYLVFWAEW